MLTITEENYIKAIFKVAEKDKGLASTNNIATQMSTTPASVTDMIKKLADKDVIHYEKYKGVRLSDLGKSLSTQLIRKHRLWEVFLVDKLNYDWKDVHEIAEQLEHIKSPTLIQKLDAFLGYPKFDPHGDPIPNENGKYTIRPQLLLSKQPIGVMLQVIAVKSQETSFLEYLNQINLGLHDMIVIQKIQDYDASMLVIINNSEEINISKKVSENIYVKQN